MAATVETRLSRYKAIAKCLVNERTGMGWDTHWQDISANLLPRRSRFLGDPASQANSGVKRHQAIIDNCAPRALNALSSGMQTTITSPARPWFKLTLRDGKLAKLAPIKRWLAEVEDVLRTVFAKSNIYPALHTLYHDLAGYGTAVCMVYPDERTVLRAEMLPIGSYCLGTDSQGRVNRLLHSYSMTITQMAEEFGEDHLRKPTRQKLADKHGDDRVTIWHLIHENDDYSPTSALSQHKRFASCYWENDASDDDVAFLRESGFDQFPVLAPRWAVTSDEDAYGYGPGMEALGDIKALQYQQRVKAQALDKIVNPPLQGPAELNNRIVSTLPGQLTTLTSQGKDGIRPIYQVQLDMGPLLEDIAAIENRIERTFFASLFLSITSTQDRQRTAEEIRALQQEQMLQLGPVLERLTPELLNPLIDLGLAYAGAANLLPPPPAEIHAGDELDVEHVSILATAQKLAGVASIERLAGFVANIVAVTKDPSLVDKYDWDAGLEIYGEAVGAPPRMLRTAEELAKIRQARQQQQQAAQAQQALTTGAATAKDLAQTPLDADSALTRLVGAGGL